MEGVIFVSCYILFLLLPTFLAKMWILFWTFITFLATLGVLEIISLSKTGKTITQRTRETIKLGNNKFLMMLPAAGIILFGIFLMCHFYLGW